MVCQLWKVKITSPAAIKRGLTLIQLPAHDGWSLKDLAGAKSYNGGLIHLAKPKYKASSATWRAPTDNGKSNSLTINRRNMRITRYQVETGNYVRNFIINHQRLPTIREIMRRFSLKSTSSAWLRLQVYKRNRTTQGYCFCCGKKLKIDK